MYRQDATMAYYPRPLGAMQVQPAWSLCDFLTNMAGGQPNNVVAVYCDILGYTYCDISCHVIQRCSFFSCPFSPWFTHILTLLPHTPHPIPSHTPPTHPTPHTPYPPTHFTQDFCSKGLAVDMRTSRLIVKALIRSSQVVTIVLDDTSIRKIK